MLQEYPAHEKLGSASEPRVSTRSASKADFCLALGLGGYDQKVHVRTGSLRPCEEFRDKGGVLAVHPRRSVWTVVAHGSGSCG